MYNRSPRTGGIVFLSIGVQGRGEDLIREKKEQGEVKGCFDQFSR